MTKTMVEENQEKLALLQRTATEIRKLLDAAREEYGAEDWDSLDMSTAVIDLAIE